MLNGKSERSNLQYAWRYPCGRWLARKQVPKLFSFKDVFYKTSTYQKVWLFESPGSAEFMVMSHDKEIEDLNKLELYAFQVVYEPCEVNK